MTRAEDFLFVHFSPPRVGHLTRTVEGAAAWVPRKETVLFYHRCTPSSSFTLTCGENRVASRDERARERDRGEGRGREGERGGREMTKQDKT